MRDRLPLTLLAGLAALAFGLGLARGFLWLSRRFPPEAEVDTSARAAATVRPSFASMSPGVTECVYALGLEAHLVAVSQFSVWPPRAAEKPQIGGWVNPNFERILQLRPDVLLVQGKYGKLSEFADRYGLRVEDLPLTDAAGVMTTLRRIAELAGRADQGRIQAEILRLELDAVRAAVEGRERPRVFFCVGREPEALRGLQTVAQGSFLTDLIGLAGGTNVFGGLANPYPVVSVEALAEAAPEVIIEARPSQAIPPEAVHRIEQEWRALPAPASRSGRIHLLTQDFLMIPGPRIVLTARLLAGCIHPDATLPEKP